VLGSLVGALLMTTIRNGCALMEWRNYITEIAAGAIIVAAAAFDVVRRRVESRG
jgi:ribose/xylose/arabinose/galactoside ABC-type transport system permease subunit